MTNNNACPLVLPQCEKRFTALEDTIKIMKDNIIEMSKSLNRHDLWFAIIAASIWGSGALP